MSNANNPAHPMPIASCNDGGSVNTGDNLHPDWRGLTKREAFAMAAMQGLAAAHTRGGKWTGNVPEAAVQAVVMADALLAALERTT